MGARRNTSATATTPTTDDATTDAATLPVVEPATDEPTTDAPTATDPTPADAAPVASAPTPDDADPLPGFVAAWRAAIDTADPTTGTIAPEHSAPVVAAARAIPTRVRPRAVADASAATVAAAMSADPVSMSAIAAAAMLAATVTDATAGPAAPVTVSDADRVAALASALDTFTDRGIGVALADAPDGYAALTITLPRAAWLNVRDDAEPETPGDHDAPAWLRARAVLLASAGKRSRVAGNGGNGSKRRAGAVPVHVAAVLLNADDADGMRDSALSRATSDAYPASGPSAGSIAAITPDAAASVGIVRTTVGGARGYRVSDAALASDAVAAWHAPASDDDADTDAASA